MYEARTLFCMTCFTVLRYQFLRLDLLPQNIYGRFCLKGMFGQEGEHLTAPFFLLQNPTQV